MSTSSPAEPDGASAESPIIYAMANDVFATRVSGGSISIEEFPKGEITKAADFADRISDHEGGSNVIVALAVDSVGGAPNDYILFHPDESDRLAVIARARAALEAAEAALLACGYVDYSEIRERRS